jgi:AraC-like DNA-binding protein
MLGGSSSPVNTGPDATLPRTPDLKVAEEWMRLARTADFKATRLASVAGVSPRTLQRRFKAEYGITVSEWLKRIRLEEASERIQAGDRVKAVAMDLGFKQLSHFSREFKRAYGLPPTRVPSTAHKAQNPSEN